MARTVRRERWFTPRLRTAALNAIADVLPRSRMRLLAVAVMSNHLHIVAQQRDRPLAALMQPLLRRLARQLHDAHGLEGPVFWRHYASRACLAPTHARNAIVYTHLNPVRAGLCEDPAGYRWTSHALYASASPVDLSPELERVAAVLDPSLALPLFATGPRRSAEGLSVDYGAFIDWRLSADNPDDEDLDSIELEPPRPPSPWQGPRWEASLSPLFHSPVRPASQIHDEGPGPFVPDLATLARNTLAAEAPGMPLDSIRGRGGSRERIRSRHAVIRRLHAAGYRNVEIARFLDLSDSAVSYVLRAARSAL